MKNGIELIAEERAAQVAREGWTQEHDDEHEDSELARAAIVYAKEAVAETQGRTFAPVLGSDGAPAEWPWDAEWYKPRDPIRNLVRAGALIAAEIDRLQREHSSKRTP